MKKIDFPFPREHGAWAMFIAPLVVGIGAAEMLNGAVALFALVALGFFLLRFPLALAIKAHTREARVSALRWSALYATLTAILGAVLLFVTQLWLLIPLGAIGFATLVVYLWLVARRAEMSVWGEWIGIAGLALGAPGAYLVATGAAGLSVAEAGATAIALYALNAFYFAGTVLYIKFKVREQPRLAPRNWVECVWAGRASIIYHTIVFALVAYFAATGALPALAAMAFVLPMCKVIGGVLTTPARLNIRRLGFIEVGLTVVFVAAILWAYR
jgi:hypothetical protein